MEHCSSIMFFSLLVVVLSVSHSAGTMDGSLHSISIVELKDPQEWIIAADIAESNSDVTITLLCTAPPRVVSQERVVRIISSVGGPLARYLQEYQRLSLCQWLFVEKEFLPVPGYNLDGGDAKGDYLVLDPEKGWRNRTFEKGSFAAGTSLINDEIIRILGPVPVLVDETAVQKAPPGGEAQQKPANGVCPVCNGRTVIPCTNPDCIHGRVKAPCPKCNGTGRETCSVCNGSKHVRCPDCGGKGSFTVHGLSGNTWLTKCKTCNGKGRVVCSFCNGRGEDTCSKCGGRKFVWVKCTVCGGDSRIPCPRCSASKTSAASTDSADRTTEGGAAEKKKELPIRFNMKQLLLVQTDHAFRALEKELAEEHAFYRDTFKQSEAAIELYQEHFRGTGSISFKNIVKETSEKRYAAIAEAFRKTYGAHLDIKRALSWFDDKQKAVRKRRAEVRSLKDEGPGADVEVKPFFVRAIRNYIDKHHPISVRLKERSSDLTGKLKQAVQLVESEKERRRMEADFGKEVRRRLRDLLPRINDVALGRGLLTIRHSTLPVAFTESTAEHLVLLGNALFPVYGEIYEVVVEDSMDETRKLKLSRREWKSLAEQKEREQQAEREKNAQALKEQKKQGEGAGGDLSEDAGGREAVVYFLIIGIIATCVLFIILKARGGTHSNRSGGP